MFRTSEGAVLIWTKTLHLLNVLFADLVYDKHKTPLTFVLFSLHERMYECFFFSFAQDSCINKLGFDEIEWKTVQFLYVLTDIIENLKRSCPFMVSAKINKIESFKICKPVYCIHVSLIDILTARCIKFWILYSCIDIE